MYVSAFHIVSCRFELVEFGLLRLSVRGSNFVQLLSCRMYEFSHPVVAAVFGRQFHRLELHDSTKIECVLILTYKVDR